MKINIIGIENSLILSDEYVYILEIENKKMYVDVIEEFSKYVNGVGSEKIKFYLNNVEENLNNKLSCYIDVFNIDYNSKKIVNALYKKISLRIEENEKLLLNESMSSFYKCFDNIINNVDIPLIYNKDSKFDDISKMLKLNIEVDNVSDNILYRLKILLDIEKDLLNSVIVIFVNLKLFLDNDQLIELYKYSKCKDLHIILLEPKSGGVSLNYEKKLLIDNDLDEFVLL